MYLTPGHLQDKFSITGPAISMNMIIASDVCYPLNMFNLFGRRIPLATEHDYHIISDMIQIHAQHYYSTCNCYPINGSNNVLG